MKRLYSLIALLLINLSFAQNDNINASKYTFAKEVFKNNYKPQKHKRFEGKITVIDDNTIKYDDKVLILQTLETDYKMIFISGLINADIITGDGSAIFKTKEEVAAMTDTERIFYDLGRNDSIQLSALTQLSLLNPDYKTKRFSFWIFRKNIMNPIECYFELHNKKAKRKNSFSDFIKNAELTYFHFGTIII